ncbi:cereblon family protein [Oceanicoccus sp. KOV_DT_Chl]|uniref:cereblon family protein n=1 Tax=Oceanicoccus sp. KOV_DT_Chl TaxID=1904639 RepID=UPI00135C51AB|nr:cereblon family protein [Oceanicoccus sp. KOV_DT_Chl]
MSDIQLDTVEKMLHLLDDIDGDLWLCRFCLNPITRSNQQTTIGLHQQYRFTNPAGITYSIRCFQHAPGCSISSQATAEHSWFGGYQWQLASCSECEQHLGWYYFSKDDQLPDQRFFFGLIGDRLVYELRQP